MHRDRKMAIATLLFAGMFVLTFIYNTYGWYGVAAILGMIVILIGMLSFDGGEENG